MTTSKVICLNRLCILLFRRGRLLAADMFVSAVFPMIHLAFAAAVNREFTTGAKRERLATPPPILVQVGTNYRSAALLSIEFRMTFFLVLNFGVLLMS